MGKAKKTKVAVAKLPPKGPASSKKKYSTEQKREYVLKNLGLMTRESMAKTLECSPTQIYNIVARLRDNRAKLITEDLISVIAEEQFNRLNMNAKLTFNDLVNERRRLEEVKKSNIRRIAKDMDPLPVDTSELSSYFYMYATAERQLTNYMKALGIYNPDILIQQNIQQGDNSTLSIEFTAEEALKEVRESYSEDVVQNIYDKIVEADWIDVDVTDDPTGQPKPVDRPKKPKKKPPAPKQVKKVRKVKKVKERLRMHVCTRCATGFTDRKPRTRICDLCRKGGKK